MAMVKTISNEVDNNVIKPDIRIISIHYNLGKYFGLTPTLSKGPVKNFWKWYVSLLLLLFLVLLGNAILGRVIVYTEYGTLLQDSIDGMHGLSDVIYIGMSLIATRFGQKNWKDLLENMELTEKKFQHENFIVSKSIALFKIEVTVYHIIFLAVHLGETMSWILGNEIRYTYIFLSFRIATYYQLYDVILICAFNQMIQRRYRYLNKIVQTTIKGSFGTLLSCDEKEKISKLKDVFLVYHMLHESVRQLEVIFGWKIFIILECTVLCALNSFHYALTSFQTKDIGSVLQENFWFILIFPLLFVATAAGLVMSCDKVEKSGKKVANSCYLHLVNMERSDLKDELLLLAEYTTKFAPKMSAAGFFTVNQSLLVSIFSSVTTYLIIIIQFHLSLVSNK